MEIVTHTDQIEHLRRATLRLLAWSYPREALKDSQPNQFLRWIEAYGLEQELGGGRRLDGIDDSHSCIHVDMSRCIRCFRCVRICEEVAGRSVWHVWGQGDDTEIRPADRVNLADSSCVSCGACVDTCPSGALRDKALLNRSLLPAEVRTVCPYCGTGCEMHVGHAGDRLTSVRPVVEAPVNKGHLCVKGRYGWQFVHAPDRVTEPMIRSGDAWQPVSWEQAIDFVAARLRKVIEQHGPGALGILGSARSTNEENYIAQKFARVVIGTNNVDCCARVCHAPTAAGMKLMLGTGAATNSFDDIETAKAFLLCGVNPTENHPIVGDRIKQAVRRGAKLIVIDPRRIDLSDYATLHLRVRPGTNIALLNAIAHVIVKERLYDTSVVPQHVDGWDALYRCVANYRPERAAEICGVPAESILVAARIYATHKPAMCFHGLGVTEHVQGTEGVMCLVNLAVMTGNLGVRGAGINPLRGQNNVQGAAHMGCDPGVLTGGVPLAENRERFEAAWRTPIPANPGRNLMKMMDAAAQGALKALWVIGYDIALTNPNATTTVRALKALEFVIVQDLFLTETARLVGTVFLPACSSFEKDGTFMNSERRIQRVRKVIEPVGQSRTDWEIMCQVASAMGSGPSFAFHSAEEIWNEIRAVWPAGAGITYARLESGGLQWPCPSEEHPGTTILHSRLFENSQRVKLRATEYRPTDEQICDEFPMLLVTGRSLYQFNAGTMTNRSKAGESRPTDTLSISAVDGERLGVSDGQMVRVRSRYGDLRIATKIDGTVTPGQLFATFQLPQAWVNNLTSDHRDRFVDTPEYKVTAVCVEL
jgi:formate dehydrogenase major subunit